MKEFSTDDYVVDPQGRELALGEWKYDDLPKVGEKVKIDGVPLIIKGIPKKARKGQSKTWKGKNIGIWI